MSAFALRGGASSNVASSGLHFSLAYNLGRITSYAAVGAAAGSIAGLAAISAPRWGHQFLELFAAGILIMSGLVMLGTLQLPLTIRSLGLKLWRRLQALSRPLLPIDSLGKAFGVGLVWGWLPCGLVYSMLALAAAQGEAGPAAAMMAAFGLGTLPGMLLANQLFNRFKRTLMRGAGRRIGAIALVALGVAFIALSLPLGIHTHLGHTH